MKIRRKDCEDYEALEELMAKNITEAVCKQFSDWLGGEKISFDLKSSIYNAVRKAQEDGIEV